MKFNLSTKAYILVCICLFTLGLSCKKKNVESDVFVKKQWKVSLSTANVVPAVTGRTDHAVAVLFLMDNGTLYYDVYFDSPVQNNDTPTHVVIYNGAAGTNGSVLLDLHSASFNAQGESKGSLIPDNTTAQALLTQSAYLAIASPQYPNGLVRGQVNP